MNAAISNLSASQAVLTTDEDPLRQLASEIKLRWKQGEPADARAALAQHPELEASRDVAFDLVYEEYCRREDEGEQPDPDEFCQRFPTFRTALRRQLLAHKIVIDNLTSRVDGAPEPAPEPPPCWPEPGDRLLGFALRRKLGQGAFARVFLATQPALGDRQVAVKVSPDGSAEAEILGRLQHPNIVHVYSVDNDLSTGLSWVCMPYLGGTTLEDVLDRAFAGGRVPASGHVVLDAVRACGAPAVSTLGDAAQAHPVRFRRWTDCVLWLTAQLADALAFAHSLGIYHRDLKPSNVLIGPDGRPMLLDFNLSYDVRLADTRLGGTVPYMSPEQLRATDKQAGPYGPALDGRSDVYSLGVMFYELLTGVHPFGPVPLKLSVDELRPYLLERQQKGPRPARQLNADIDPALEGLLRRCLAWEPVDRPQSAAELATALRRALSPLRRARRWVRHHPWTTAAVAVFAVMLTTAAIAFASFREPYPLRQLNGGLEAYHNGQYTEAIALFTRSLEADESLAAAYFARGRAYQQLGDADASNWMHARDDFDRAYRHAPDGKTKACIGYCLNRLRENPAAIPEYTAAIQSGFASAEVHNNLGYSYIPLKQFDAALKSLDTAIALDPRLQAAHLNRARLHLNKAQVLPTEISEEEIQKLRDQQPKASEKEIQKLRDEARRARLNEIQKLRDQARGDFARAIAAGPAPPALYLDAARVAAMTAKQDPKQKDEGVAYVKKAVADGYDPHELRTDTSLKNLELAKVDLGPAAGPFREHSAAATPRLVDPVKDAAK